MRHRRNERNETFLTVPCELRGVKLKPQSPNEGEVHGACVVRGGRGHGTECGTDNWVTGDPARKRADATSAERAQYELFRTCVNPAMSLRRIPAVDLEPSRDRSSLAFSQPPRLLMMPQTSPKHTSTYTTQFLDLEMVS